MLSVARKPVSKEDLIGLDLGSNSGYGGTVLIARGAQSESKEAMVARARG